MWELLESYKEEKMPGWLSGNPEIPASSQLKEKGQIWTKENETTVGIVDYVSLRPEFSKWTVGIKGGVKDDPNISCGVYATQDALEYLWSKRVGFPVKADPKLIRKAFDTGNAKQGIKWEGKNAEGKPLSENTNTRLLEYIRNDGGYSVLSDESKRKIGGTNLPKLVARELSLSYLNFKSYIRLNESGEKSKEEVAYDERIRYEQKNGTLKLIPISALMVDELKQGHVILAAGGQARPKSLPAKEHIQSQEGSSKKGYPYPKTEGWPCSHAQLITGFFVQEDTKTFPQGNELFWEFRGNWGTSYADDGYAYVRDREFRDSYSTELLSLSLE